MILEESLVGSPLVQIVWQRLQYLDNSLNSVGGVWRRNLAAAVRRVQQIRPLLGVRRT